MKKVSMIRGWSSVYSDEEVHGGIPCIGSRLPVSIILGNLSEGMSIEELVQNTGYERDEIVEAIHFSAYVLGCIYSAKLGERDA